MRPSGIKHTLKLLNARPIAYYPIYHKITGSLHGAVVLSQLMYWLSKKDKIYKTNKELMEELGFTERELKTAKRALKKATFITVTREGLPAKTYYEINWAEYEKVLDSIHSEDDETVTTSWDETVLTVDDETVPTIDDETVLSLLYTENTTENTTENKKEKRKNTNARKKSPKKYFSEFDYFILEIEERFKENSILTFKNKINATVAKPHFDKSSNYMQIASSYTEYVKRNKSVAVRLDKYLIANSEGNLDSIEYGKSSQRQVHTQSKLEAYMAKKRNVIDVEVDYD